MDLAGQKGYRLEVKASQAYLELPSGPHVWPKVIDEASRGGRRCCIVRRSRGIFQLQGIWTPVVSGLCFLTPKSIYIIYHGSILIPVTVVDDDW